MPGLSRKETDRLLEHIAPQGVVITPTKNGKLLRLPNGRRTVVHYSVSDYRGPQKLKAELKRAGVTWPTDKHDQNVKKKGKPYPATLELLDPALRKLGHPERVRNAEIRAVLPPGTEVPNSTIRTYMSWRGYESQGKTQAQVWVRPAPEASSEPETVRIETKPDQAPKRRALRALPTPAPEPEPTPAPEPEPTPAPEPERVGDTFYPPTTGIVPEPQEAPEPPAEPEPVPEPELPEIAPETPAEDVPAPDGSWVIDWDALEDVPLSQIRQVLWAAGVDVELRAKRG